MRARLLVLVLLPIVIVIAAVCVLFYSSALKSSGKVHGKRILVVCHAGSLSEPLRELEKIFEEKYGVDVVRIARGSVEVVRMVTDLHKRCDVVAVADYRLIPMYMMPKYAKWYIAFARNDVVIAFTNKSKYAEEALRHPQKIFDILSRPDVRYGFSNPNMDPCGYRAVGIIALASLYYKNETILRELLLSKIPGVKVRMINGTLHIYIPATFELPTGSRLVIRPKSVDLISLLQAGDLDYAFEYRSVAIQKKLLFVELPPELNLGDPRYDKWYSRVVVHILHGTPKEREIVMKSIVYGVTVPTTCVECDLALEFVKLLLSKTGREVFERLGQPFLEKPFGSGEIPPELRKYVEVVK